MVRTLTVALGAAAFATLAYAAGDSPQEQRWKLMDEIGTATQTVGDMVKGETAYDVATAEDALETIIQNGAEFPMLFPPGSETGHDTRATPAIWSDSLNFELANQAMLDAAQTALVAAPGGLEQFARPFRELGQTCRACHTDYRAEKE